MIKKASLATIALITTFLVIYLFTTAKGIDPPGLGAEPSDPLSSEESTGSSVSKAQSNSLAPERQARSAQASAEALPNPTTPLTDQISVLLDEARRGNTVATCRLVISVNRCKEIYRSARLTAEMQSALESREGNSDATAIDLIARSVERGDSNAVFCQGVDEDNLPDVSSLIERSLHSFSTRQKTILALTQVDGSLRRIRRPAFQSLSGLYVIPQFQADYALEFLLEGFRSRDPLALEGLVLVYAPGRTFAPHGPGIWLPNPREFLFYATLMHQVYGAESLGESGLRLAHYSTLALSEEESRRQVDRAILESKLWLGTDEKPTRSINQAVADFGIFENETEPSC